MNLKRRSFIGSVLALSAAPTIVRAASLMPLSVPKKIIEPDFFLYGLRMDPDGYIRGFSKVAGSALWSPFSSRNFILGDGSGGVF